MVYLVRHAHAGDKRRWPGRDEVRPLSDVGIRQAYGLLDRLAGYPVTRILSSPTERCRQTVAPLAVERGLEVEYAEVLGLDADDGELLRLVRDPRFEAAVLCTHGEVIERLFGQLLAGGLRPDGAPRWAKGSVWVLDGAAGVPREGRYLAPVPLHD
ncbi:MAG TPA: phosphoglycerate mutase family protein [Actinomycetes bacterium]